MKKIFISGLLLLMTINVNAAEIEDFSSLASWVTQYRQDNFGQSGYKYGALCEITFTFGFDYSGSACGSGERYIANSWQIISVCNETNIISQYDGSSDYIVNIFWPLSNQTENENQLGYTGPFRNTDTASDVTCYNNNKTCILSNSGANVCVRADYWSFAGAGDKLYHINIPHKEVPRVDTELDYTVYTRNIGLVTDIAVQNYSGVFPYDYYGTNDLTDIHYFLEAVSETLGTIGTNTTSFSTTKDVIINITGAPDSVILSNGYVGIWQCEEPLDYAETGGDSDDYNNMIQKSTCTNVLNSNFVNSPDENGNFQKSDISSDYATPRAIYYYNTVSTTKIINEAVNFDTNEDTVIVTMPWFSNNDEAQICIDVLFNGNFVSDFTLYERFDNGNWYNSGNYSSGWCIGWIEGVSYDVKIIKDGYLEKTNYYIFNGIQNFDINLIKDYETTDTINYTYRITNSSGQNISYVGTSLICYLNGENYYTKSKTADENGTVMYTGIIPDSNCHISYTDPTNAYESGSTISYTTSENGDSTISMENNENYDNEASKRLIILRRTDDKPIVGATAKITGCSTENLYTSDTQGFVYLDNIDTRCEYVAVVKKTGYYQNTKTVLGSYQTAVYLTEIRNEAYGELGVTLKYNGTKFTTPILVEILKDGSIISSENTDSNGYTDFSLNPGEKYTVRVNYKGNDYTKVVTMLGEGKTVDIVIDLFNNLDEEAAKTQEFEWLVYTVLWPLLTLTLTLFAISVLLKTANNLI